MLINIFILSLFWPFSYSLMQFPSSILKLSTQHPPYFFKLSTQHQSAITRIENWALLPTRGLQFSYTLIRAFSKYLRTPKQYSSIQQRIPAWTNSSRRARRHVWCWVEFHPHHCLRGESVDPGCIGMWQFPEGQYQMERSDTIAHKCIMLLFTTNETWLKQCLTFLYQVNSWKLMGLKWRQHCPSLEYNFPPEMEKHSCKWSTWRS